MKACLLAKLAPRALERRLAVLAQAGGELEHLAAHRGARLTHEGHMPRLTGTIATASRCSTISHPSLRTTSKILPLKTTSRSMRRLLPEMDKTMP